MAPTSQNRLTQYINLILEVGLNLRAGQRLLVAGSALHGVDLGLAPFVRHLAEAAYEHGAALVDVVWWDPALDLLRLRKAPSESLGQSPRWFAGAMLEHIEAADAFLRVLAEDPEALSGIEPGRVAAHLAGLNANARPARAHILRNAINWCSVSVPIPAWAAKVLPDVPEGERIPRLWDLIFETCRLKEADPIAAWRDHIGQLSKRSAYLTEKQYSELTYSAPGTRLTVGLPPGHVWHGGQVTAANGIDFVPNLPTEEIFTLPHRARVDGDVSATKPFEYGGSTIEGMDLTFAEGQVVKFTARRGEELLRMLLETDAGSRRLGEVALVPHSSPLSRLGVTFHNTLYDENAASHLALGSAYRFTLSGGESETDDAFAERGGNQSLLHCDFMIGSAAMDVDGIPASGAAEPVMRAGEWAFRV